jgi:hypothetical protein
MTFEIVDRYIACNKLSQNASMGVASNGDILLTYGNYPDCMAGEKLYLCRSADRGQTWSDPEFVVESEQSVMMMTN